MEPRDTGYKRNIRVLDNTQIINRDPELDIEYKVKKANAKSG